MNNIIIGNIISFISAAFLAVSCVVKNRKHIFILQFLNCAILAIASYFFGSYAAISTLILCCIRNIFIAKDKYTAKVMTVILVLVIVLGLLTNNRGLIGLLPVMATVEYTICCYLIKDVHKTRISIFVNETIWVIYSLLVLDFSTALTDIIVIAVDLAVLFKKPKVKEHQN